MPAPEVEEALGSQETSCDDPDLLLAGERRRHELRHLDELLQPLPGVHRRQVSPRPAEGHPEEIDRGQRRQERLRRGDADLGAGVRVHDTRGLPSECRADDVRDREHRGTALPGRPNRPERVGRLARLGERHDQRVASRGSNPGSGTRSRGRPPQGARQAARRRSARRARHDTRSRRQQAPHAGFGRVSRCRGPRPAGRRAPPRGPAGLRTCPAPRAADRRSPSA